MNGSPALFSKEGAVRRRRVFCSIMLLCIIISACTAQEAGAFRCDIENRVTNLDPQFATSREAKMIIGNLFEGLVVQQPTGEIIPGIAHSWEISQDNLTYTFYLREGLYWPDVNRTPLRAGDFSFALYRLFDPETPSPYAEDFSAIRGARRRLSGQTVIIGARPIGDYTLVIELERPDPMFLAKLASTAAMPCNPAFFAASRGRYGLEARFVLGNGPFTPGVWGNDRIVLNKNEHYHSPENVPPRAVFYIGRGNPAEHLEAGRSDFARVSAAFSDTAQRMGLEMSAVDGVGRLWCISFNTRDPAWRWALLRRAVSMSIDPGVFEDMDAGLGHITPYDVEEAARLFALGTGLAELATPPTLTILIPASGGHMRYMEQLRQDWQANLSFFPRLQEMPDDTIRRRIASGDYQAILTPVEWSAHRPGETLEALRYRNPLYDMFLERAKAALTLEDMYSYYAHAQAQLLSDAPLIPLYFETAWYAATKEARPFSWVYLGGRGEQLGDT